MPLLNERELKVLSKRMVDVPQVSGKTGKTLKVKQKAVAEVHKQIEQKQRNIESLLKCIGGK